MFQQEGGDWHTTKYMDVADVPTEQDTEPQMWDRRLLYCVPVWPCFHTMMRWPSSIPKLQSFLPEGTIHSEF